MKTIPYFQSITHPEIGVIYFFLIENNYYSNNLIWSEKTWLDGSLGFTAYQPL